jgi:hypothetical protein
LRPFLVKESCHAATHRLEFHLDHFFDDLVVDFEDLLLLEAPLVELESTAVG